MMTYESIRALISMYVQLRTIEENARKLGDYINETRPSGAATLDEQLEHAQSCAERFDPLTGKFDDK